MKNIDYYQALATEMIANDKDKNTLYEAMDKMWHDDWKLPDEIANDVRSVPSSDPHDAIASASRVLSTLEPNYKYQPYGGNDASKERANQVERWLKWMMRGASRRSQSNIVRDVVLSALLYDAVCVQVTYIPWQKKTLATFGGDPRRIRMAKRYSPFIVQTRNPQNVHARYSDLMPECVLFCNQTTIRAAKAYWGDKGKGIESLLKDKKDPKYEEHKIVIYDYTDYDVRCVWAVDAEDVDEAATTSNFIIIPPTAHELPFIHWVTRVGGTMLDVNPEYQVQPMLAGIYRTGLWDTQNVAQSLWMSEMIDLAQSAIGAVTGPAPDTIDVDHNKSGNLVRLPTGYTYTPIQKTPFDQGLFTVVDKLTNNLNKATVSRVLQNGDIPSGTAFSTLNLATQTAVGALKPYKALAEQALADICILMLEWIHFTGDTSYAWGTGKDDLGIEYKINADEIDPESLIIDVELTPDVPTDRQSRINAASIAVDKLGYPQEMGLEDIGVADPQQAIRTRRREMLEDFMLQMQFQNMQQQAQMQMQQQVMAQQQQPGTPPGIQGAEGMGFNPAAGGQPPQQMMPQATYEGQTGMTRTGEEIVE